MIPQIINIIAGFLLGAPKIKEWLGASNATGTVQDLEKKAAPHMQIIGWVVLVVGVLTLLDRIDLAPAFDVFGDDSYPQAIPLILMGLLMFADFFKKYPKVYELIQKVEPYRVWIGIWGIAAGLVSILFGCPIC